MRNQRAILPIAICVILLTCPVAHARPKPKAPQKIADPIIAAQNRVAETLRDPESARFSDSFRTGGGTVCGAVNAKNAYGGYTGKTRFIASVDQIWVEPTAGSSSFEYRWVELCADDVPASGR